ncbi:MAG TPA: pilus assembly protein TadG-related protein [Paludibaculum sp.]|jgi:Flp pilus assembly protein TadG
MQIRRQGQKGFVLIMMAVCLVLLLGMLGLVFDLGRAFIAKNEAQAFTDACALAAAVQLNGESSGLANAATAVTTMTAANKWQFNTRSFATVNVEFSTNKTNWATAPASPTGVRYARVTTTTNSVTMYLLSVLGTAKTMNVAAMSMAGGEMPTKFSQGVFPFAPLAHSATPPNFGYSYGDELTLLWPSSVGSNGPVKLNNLCGADRNMDALNAVQAGTTSDRGYIQDTSASAIASSIEDDHLDYVVALNSPVSRTGGIKGTDVNQSLDDRVAQDSSPNVVDYNGYITSHDSSPLRRVVLVPIVSDAINATVVGFAKVFLPPSQPKNPNDAKCAMYIGPADGTGGNMANGANIVRLFQ